MTSRSGTRTNWPCGSRTNSCSTPGLRRLRRSKRRTRRTSTTRPNTCGITWTMSKEYKCANCDLEFWLPQSLEKHMSTYHPIKSAFAALVDKYMKNEHTTKYPGWNAKPEEAHMTSTMTIDPKNLGKAKKQRDTMRERYRVELQKFAHAYNVSLFEATHAVLDSIIKNVDDYMYGEPSMPNGLAQTLLPSTEAKILKAEAAAPASPSTLSVGSWEKAIMKDKAKNKASGKPDKLDKYVTEADITAYIVWYCKKSAHWNTTHKALQETYGSTHYVVQASGYLLPGNKYVSDEYGYHYMVIRLVRSMPYISEAMLNAFKPIAPKGMKWRKLKNKAI